MSRFPSALQEHKTELENQGLDVRITSGQIGIHDFCFLMSTKKELIGMVHSICIFAAFLGPSLQKIMLHSPVSGGSNKKH